MEKKESAYFYVMTLNVVHHGMDVTATYDGMYGTYDGTYDADSVVTAYEAYTAIRDQVHAMLLRDIAEGMNPSLMIKASDVGTRLPIVLYYHLERNLPVRLS